MYLVGLGGILCADVYSPSLQLCTFGTGGVPYPFQLFLIVAVLGVRLNLLNHYRSSDLPRPCSTYQI